MVTEYPPPSEKAFKEMARDCPTDLARWIPRLIKSGHRGHASVALVALGDAGELYTWLLAYYLQDPVSIVREGAMIGLKKINSFRAMWLMELASENDPAPELRELAKDFLEEN